MKRLLPILLATCLHPAPASAQPASDAGAVTVEHYYRIKWGSADEFKRLYKKNHEPLLAEMRKQGFITSVRTDEPFTHMGGAQRWDLRVTITYRDAAAAVLVGGRFDRAFEAAKARLYPDKAKLEAEEAQRFALLDEHWDVVMAPATP